MWSARSRRVDSKSLRGRINSLPRGIAKRQVPPEMLRRLPARAGHEWRAIGTDLVLYPITSGIVEQVLQDVFFERGLRGRRSAARLPATTSGVGRLLTMAIPASGPLRQGLIAGPTTGSVRLKAIVHLLSMQFPDR